MQLRGNTILITGGSSGIGRGLAEAFHARGNHVIIAGRRNARLEEVVSHYPGMQAVVLDIEKASSINQVAAELIRAYPSLNVVINNAGMMPREWAEEALPSRSAEIVATNLLGPILLTEALLPLLKQQPSAALLNVSSGAAFVPMARFPTYSATKAALHSYSESMRYNLRETSVQVIEIAPPYVATELTGPAQAKDPHAMPLAEFIEEVLAILEATPDSPEVVVQRIKFARNAESDGTRAEVFNHLNAWIDEHF